MSDSIIFKGTNPDGFKIVSFHNSFSFTRPTAKLGNIIALKISSCDGCIQMISDFLPVYSCFF